MVLFSKISFLEDLVISKTKTLKKIKIHIQITPGKNDSLVKTNFEKMYSKENIKEEKMVTFKYLSVSLKLFSIEIIKLPAIKIIKAKISIALVR